MTKGVYNQVKATQGESTLGLQRGFAVTIASTISNAAIAQSVSLVMFNNSIT